MKRFEDEAQFRPDFIRSDSETLRHYGRDWTREWDSNPRCVAFPKSTEEVSRLLQLCRKHKVAVVPSGGRTGLAGGAVAAQQECVLSLEKMSALQPVDTRGSTVRVQAGAITATVRAHCEKAGLTWPIRFGADGSSQIGGNIATNAGGVHVIRYGTVRSWVLGLQVVLMNGEVLELNRALEKNNSGLPLHQLFIGSEGTLGVITEAVLKLAPVCKETSLVLMPVPGMEEALGILEEARSRMRVRAFEWIDASSLEVVAESVGVDSPFADLGAAVLMEVEGRDIDLDVDGIVARSPEDVRSFWALREGITEALAKQGMVHKNDIAVPLAALHGFTQELKTLLEGSWKVFVFGHLGDGNLHVNAVQPAGTEKKKFLDDCRKADEKIFTLVQKHGGTISAEHGIGLLKKEYLQYSRSAEEIRLMRELKRVFDPEGLLNPGKVFA